MKSARCSTSSAYLVQDIVTTNRDTHRHKHPWDRLLGPSETHNIRLIDFAMVIQPADVDVNVCSVANCVPLLIQWNVDGSPSFNRSWEEFKVGFGDKRGNYWIGNERLSQLTSNGRYKLKFYLMSRSSSNRNWYWAEYSTFRVLTEADNYKLQVSGYSATPAMMHSATTTACQHDVHHV